MSNSKMNGGKITSESDLIDRYLDGLLSEPEREELEARCFRDDAFFMEVREREALRDKVARVIREDGEEIFSPLSARPDMLSQLAKRIKKFFAPEGEFISHWGYALAAAGTVAIITFGVYKILNRDTSTGPAETPWTGVPADTALPRATEPAAEQPETAAQEPNPEPEIDVKQV